MINDYIGTIIGGVGAFFMAMFAGLGFNKRINDLNEDKLDITQFNEFKEAQSIEHKHIDGKLDKIYSHLINGGKK